jgi:pimeloyl-ACP methyl ester carboxylesterase
MTLRHFTVADGASLAYSDDGSGLPVLCLAGLTRNSGDFDFVAPHLPDVRLIRMDYRGRGQSDQTGAASYTIVQEAQDALTLLDHLRIDRAAILGTSRGGLIGMYLALTARDRLAGLCLNDIGPVMESGGLDGILTYIGRNPPAPTLAALAARLPEAMLGFADVPPQRWLAFAGRLYEETPQGLRIRYDPALRDAVVTAFAMPELDLWPMFDACAGLPLALVRGANSDLLSRATADEMMRRRPDMIFAEVPGRGHVPFLDEPQSLAAITAWLKLIR